MRYISDDDALLQQCPRTLRADWEHGVCMLCEQLLESAARSKCRSCDKDKIGQLLERLNNCRGNDLEKFRWIGLSMVEKRKHGRTAAQRDTVVSMLETHTLSLTVYRTRGVLLTMVEYIEHQNEHEAHHDGGGGEAHVE